MKVKSLPTDFIVREITKVKPNTTTCTTATTCDNNNAPTFSLYRLDKTSIGTLEAIDVIVKSWKLPRDHYRIKEKKNYLPIVSFGGLKDRHAQTSQYVTIKHGPAQDFLRQSNRTSQTIHLSYLGTTTRHYDSKDIEGNQFEILLRNINQDQKHRIEQILLLEQQRQPFGMVNYFDNQRFGSVGESKTFMAHAWCLGKYEIALYMALAEEHKRDRSREEQQKQVLRDEWGNWYECLVKLKPSMRKNIVRFMMTHPTNFKRAVARIHPNLRSIYIAAFQSHLWNQWLSKIIEIRCGEENITRLSTSLGPLAIPKQNNHNDDWDWLRNLELPLPTARQKEWPSEYVHILDEILQKEYDMERRHIRIKYPRDSFFSQGMRPCWFEPSNLQYQWQDDDLHPNASALHLQFDLPRGMYATMLIKAIQQKAKRTGKITRMDHPSYQDA